MCGHPQSIWLISTFIKKSRISWPFFYKYQEWRSMIKKNSIISNPIKCNRIFKILCFVTVHCTVVKGNSYLNKMHYYRCSRVFPSVCRYRFFSLTHFLLNFDDNLVYLNTYLTLFLPIFVTYLFIKSGQMTLNGLKPQIYLNFDLIYFVTLHKT